jgi:hypothetical protein
MSLSIITSDGSEEVLEPANEMYICCKEIFNEVKEQYEELPLCLRILHDLLEKMKQIRDQVKDSSKDQVKDSSKDQVKDSSKDQVRDISKNNACLIELYEYIKSLDYLVYLYNQGQKPIEGIRAKHYIESSCNDETTIKKILRE